MSIDYFQGFVIKLYLHIDFNLLLFHFFFSEENGRVVELGLWSW